LCLAALKGNLSGAKILAQYAVKSEVKDHDGGTTLILLDQGNYNPKTAPFLAERPKRLWAHSDDMRRWYMPFCSFS
jgi:hypothetical protein